ncbi:SDR family NAD(P)-dependent oxidoreductase [Croceicoccus sp. F390]|uniref:SDR family NAD(P)-dependent oxidoreductase n=1 Tax=Croceicoccus esteveae TaxID=3075597 RepID=A0ABU2ZI62_9SPHN|nr:SDR family NAD(P)-dependent oxidoreductase [Croceicoccus sp. F390]MDT0575989.1 SDR family NAD(P)-dependent oxidoreductase [Croceicoccus sp. F390]
MANVFVAGASRGIGLELVRRHAARGDRVFALVRNVARQQDLQTLAGAQGAGAEGKVTLHELDAGDIARVDDAVAALGDTPVDMLYLVAGVSGPAGPELSTPIDWNEWDNAYDIMVKGPLAIFKALLPQMHDGTKVVCFSSQLAASTWELGGYYCYAGAKAALNAMMRAVARDVQDQGIIVTLLHPGWVQTDMGGPQAELPVEDSVTGIVTLADRLTMADTGGFFKWNGEAHPW